MAVQKSGCCDCGEVVMRALLWEVPGYKTVAYGVGDHPQAVRNACLSLLEDLGSPLVSLGAFVEPEEPRMPKVLWMTDDEVGMLPDIQRQRVEEQRTAEAREYRDAVDGFYSELMWYNDLAEAFGLDGDDSLDEDSIIRLTEEYLTWGVIPEVSLRVVNLL